MKITVRLYSTLREILPPEQRGVAQVDLPGNSNLQDLLNQIGYSTKSDLFNQWAGRTKPFPILT